MYYYQYKIKNLVNLKGICYHAWKNKYAIGQYNINNLEWTKTILQVCNELKSPVILGVSEGAKTYMGGIKTVVGMVTGLIRDLNITIPVVLHLDHGKSFETCKEAIEEGFSSVMFDGSHLQIEKNVEITKKLVELAHKHNVSVEGEVGLVGEGQDDIAQEGVVYAKLNDVVALAKTGIDIVAASYGSVHGIYHLKPNIGFEEIKTASKTINKPLVLHGGSGLNDEIIQKAISCGEAKINVNTELQIAFAKSVREYFEKHLDNPDNKGYDPRKIIAYGMKHGFTDELKSKIYLFGSQNKH